MTFKTYYLVWWGDGENIDYEEDLMCITDDKQKAQVAYDNMKTFSLLGGDVLKITEFKVDVETGETF
jgi:hypothetical protein